jgi:hypothetical protein
MLPEEKIVALRNILWESLWADWLVNRAETGLGIAKGNCAKLKNKGRIIMSTDDRGYEAPLSEREMHEEEFVSLYGKLPAKYLDSRKKEILRARDKAREINEAKLQRKLFKYIHRRGKADSKRPPRAALCLSGGGIRSSTFALGIVQALSQYGLLKQFDYLSTVSGGGYIGGWLSAWIHRNKGGGSGVLRELRRSAGRDKIVDARHRHNDNENNRMPSQQLNPEPIEIQHLRDYSNYLTPKLGLLRLDAWTLVATYFRNLVLNWLVLIPLLAGVLLLPRIYAGLMGSAVYQHRMSPNDQTAGTGMFIALIALLAIALVALGNGLPSVNRLPVDRSEINQNKNGAEELFRPIATWYVLSLIVLPLVVKGILASFSYQLLQKYSLSLPLMLKYSGISCGIFCGLGFITWAVARFANKPNRPRLIPLCLVLISAGVITGVARAILMEIFMIDPQAGIVRAVMIACTTVPAVLTMDLLLITLYVGFTSTTAGGDDDREWLARIMACILMVAVLWTVCFAISLASPYLVEWIYGFKNNYLNWMIAALPVAGTAVGLLGGIGTAPVSNQSGNMRRFFNWFVSVVPSLVAPFAVLCIFILLALGLDKSVHALSLWWLGTAKLENDLTLYMQELPVTIVLSLALCAISIVCGLLMNSNRLSLHAVYRDRLIRAFLGASNSDRKADPFTKFDAHDNVPMHHLRRGREFTKSDLKGRASDENPWWRVRGVAEMLTNQKIPFMQSLWRKADAQIPTINRLMENIAQTRDESLWKDGSKTVLDALNVFACDRELVSMSRFKNPEVRAKFPEIDRAFARLKDDGCPMLLNRLILEEEFAEVDPAGERETVYYLKPIGRKPKIPRPLHVVNVALNLVNNRNLAWQQRKAESFTISPLHSGFNRGYRPSVEYGCGVTLGTAMTISGAAASPNMGYHSSPAVTFLLTLFNVRLGWWLGNPAEVSEHLIHRIFRLFGLELKWGSKNTSYLRRDPRHSFLPLINEAMGRTTDEYPYVYLSDGGHFENLGIYEMARRRCHYIVVSDAGCDPQCNFEDLGNAIRKIQVDLGIPITINEVLFYPSVQPMDRGKFCAVGTIDYPAADGPDAEPGHLIYFKAARHPLEPTDVYNYGQTNPSFPHETTANQWFTESQFESYRKLGFWTVDTICEDWNKLAASDREANRTMTLKNFYEAALNHTKTRTESDGLKDFLLNQVLRGMAEHLPNHDGAPIDRNIAAAPRKQSTDRK